VIRHVAAAGGDVGGFGHSVQEDFLGRESRGDARRQVTVVRKEIVAAGPERHAERELDRIVTRARGVVAPPESLLQVVGRLVVEHPREVHDRVPLLQFLAGRAGKGGRRQLGGFSRRQRFRPSMEKVKR
jgi:hypothetical protein